MSLMRMEDILPVAADTEQLIVVVMRFRALYIFIFSFTRTQSTDGERRHCGITVDLAGLNLQTHQF